jgi:hypothetical protein
LPMTAALPVYVREYSGAHDASSATRPAATIREARARRLGVGTDMIPP